ncbi:Aurora kinase C [Sarcoptes scabiei]|uniref:Aurora kinase n=1 Tax=Sarcoptes scabiei TaxID=52283 RepID=A0A834R5M0_SARSC|nr:Aurora kinase C [Sarcoptes scabiei]
MVGLTLNDFYIGKRLARGKNGNVYLAKTKRFNYLVAIKALDKKILIQNQMQLQLKREIEIHFKLCHVNIIKAFDYFYDSQRIYLVMEYAPKGELFNLLQKVGRFNDCTASRIMAQVINAVRYFHRMNILHRDIKPENILISYGGVIKLSDFGWSIQSDQVRRTLCGTIAYMAPEITQCLPYNRSVDLWCLGVLAYELLVGSTPFYQNKFNFGIIENYDFQVPSYVSPYAKVFIENLLRIEPGERMSLRNCQNHEWIKLYDKLDLLK